MQQKNFMIWIRIMAADEQLQVKDLEQFLEQAMEAAATTVVVEQNPLKALVQELEGELNPNFFLDNNANSGSKQQQRFIEKNKIKEHRSPSSERYSPTSVKSRNFLANISYNQLKHED